MPRFGSVLSSLQSKIEEARISDLNYELGKLVQDTKCYFSTTFRSSSNSFRASVPKSTSLPLFPASHHLSKSVEPVKVDKYKYRSSFIATSDEDILSGQILEEEEEENQDESPDDSTVVEKFIRVIESSGAAPPSSAPLSSKKASHNTREDIRRKLAFGRPQPPPPEISKKAPNDLEVCFINEIVDDDDLTPKKTCLTRSQSEYTSLSVSKVSQDETTVEKLMRCKHDARRKMMIERRHRTFHEVNTFNKLIGRSIEGKLTDDLLTQMNTATIQVIVNDFHNKIEKLNEELVNELMLKDELQIEQDGQLVDIDDLTQSLSRKS